MNLYLGSMTTKKWTELRPTCHVVLSYNQSDLPTISTPMSCCKALSNYSVNFAIKFSVLLTLDASQCQQLAKQDSGRNNKYQAKAQIGISSCPPMILSIEF